MANGPPPLGNEQARILWEMLQELKKPRAVPVSVDGNIQSLVGEISETNNNLAALIRTLGGEAQPTSEIDQIGFRQEVTASQGVTLSELIPANGHITDVIIHWPAGCNGLVYVRLKHGTVPFCPTVPRDGWLALDDVTQTFRFWESVKIGEKLFCEIENGDSLNSHTISAIIHMQRSG